MLKAVGGRRVPRKELTVTEVVKEGPDTLAPAGERIWIRPAFDGLQVFVSELDEVRDNGYYWDPSGWRLRQRDRCRWGDKRTGKHSAERP